MTENNLSLVLVILYAILGALYTTAVVLGLAEYAQRRKA